MFMKTFKLQMQRTKMVVLTLFIVPLSGVALLLSFLLNYDQPIPDWALLTGSFVFMALLIVATVWVTKHKAVVPCSIIIDENGLKYILQKKSFLYRRKEFFATWDNIKNIGESFNVQTSTSFYQISFKQPSFTINLDAIKGQEEDATTFYQQLVYFKNLYNVSHAQKEITSKGFYDSWWARALTHVTYVFILLIIGIKLFKPEVLTWWRIAGFCAFAITWLINFHANARKKKDG